ncbi:MAG TPA: aldehyde-activating protein [Cyanobacteria bacterium UBA11372]|nr:aldehyde-activating protein [Cyanobacteria bacterium UBA11372]
MSNVMQGGCLCGAVRYEYLGELGSANYCHCRDCRKTTGGAFNIGVWVDATGLRILTGQVRSFTKIGESGKRITREFCPECGSPLLTKSPSKPQFVKIKAGSLDAPSQIKPAYQSWMTSAVSWAYISADLPGYLKNRIE